MAKLKYRPVFWVEYQNRKMWQHAWKVSPDKMIKAQAKATKAAQQINKERKDRLITDFLGCTREDSLTTDQLYRRLASMVRNTGGIPRKPRLKAMRIRLVRYGIVSYDESTCAWKVKVA